MCVKYSQKTGQEVARLRYRFWEQGTVRLTVLEMFKADNEVQTPHTHTHFRCLSTLMEKPGLPQKTQEQKNEKDARTHSQ